MVAKRGCVVAKINSIIFNKKSKRNAIISTIFT